SEWFAVSSRARPSVQCWHLAGVRGATAGSSSSGTPDRTTTGIQPSAAIDTELNFQRTAGYFNRPGMSGLIWKENRMTCGTLRGIRAEDFYVKTPGVARLRR